MLMMMNCKSLYGVIKKMIFLEQKMQLKVHQFEVWSLKLFLEQKMQLKVHQFEVWSLKLCSEICNVRLL